MPSPQLRPASKPSLLAGPAMLCLLIMLVHMAISGGRIAVSLTALQLGRSTFEVGILIAVFALLPALLSVKAGQLLDKIGPWKPMQLCVMTVIIGAVLPLLWQDLIALIISAVCIGIGHMVFQIAIQRQLGLGSNEERMRNFSWLSLSLATSGLIGPLVTGISIDQLGHRYVFGLLALGPIFCLAGLYRIRSDLLASHIKSTQPKEKSSVFDLLAIAPLRKVFAANMLLSGAWDTHMFVVPIFGVGIGLSATTIGVVLSSFAAATIVVRLALPFIQRYLKPWHLIHLAMVIAGLNFLIYPLFSQVWILMTMSFILGIALGSTQPGILALLQQHAPPGRAGEAFGVRMALINTVQVSLPLTFGALGAIMGIMPLFWMTAAGLGAGRWFTRSAGKEAPLSNVELPPDPKS
ncbi:MFS transporter [Sheuella amnicola]|nr:MFS transporter [Sheuella amnicola]HBI83274.1 MFS transporter [Alcaligenaceae bacterium]